MGGYRRQREVAQVEQHRLPCMVQRVDVVAEEAGGLALGEEGGQGLDRRVEPVAALRLEQEPGEFLVPRQVVELGPDQAAEPLDRRQPRQRQSRDGRGDLGAGLVEDRARRGRAWSRSSSGAAACSRRPGARSGRSARLPVPLVRTRCGRRRAAVDGRRDSCGPRCSRLSRGPGQVRGGLSRANSTRSRPPRLAR